jgi:hypothetical protein
MATFGDEDLSGSTFDWTDLSGSTFRAASLSNVTIRGTDLHHVKMTGVELIDVDISGEIEGLRINGVDVTQFVADEMDRRNPDRIKMRPDDPAGFREAWDLLEDAWAGTVEHARRLDPALLHERVDGEWSFIETLRHLNFATAAWIGRAIDADPSPWHPLDRPWDEAPTDRGFPRDLDARPTLDDVLEIRRERQASVRRVIEDLTEEALAAPFRPPADDGWPTPAYELTVKDCLRIVLNEEWEHRQYAERDLAQLQQQASGGGGG